MEINDVIKLIGSKDYLKVVELREMTIPENFLVLHIRNLVDFLEITTPSNPKDKRIFFIYKYANCFYIVDCELHVIWIYVVQRVGK